jgi:hypothetical protein
LPLWSLTFLFLLLPPASSQRTDSNGDAAILVRAVNPLDGVAVVETPKGRLRMVEDRLVLERLPGPSSDAATIWLYVGESLEKPSRVVVFARKAPTNDVAQPGAPVETKASPLPGAAAEVGNEKADNGSKRTRAEKKQR